MGRRNVYSCAVQFAFCSQLVCGHVFHYRCCQRVLINKWTGPRITFGFQQCPICKVLSFEFFPMKNPAKTVKNVVTNSNANRFVYVSVFDKKKMRDVVRVKEIVNVFPNRIVFAMTIFVLDVFRPVRRFPSTTRG